MRNSPFAEHKLDLSSYVRGVSGGILRAKVRAHSNLTDSEIDALINQAPRLEFYMPVDTHRRTWTGSSDIIVASVHDEGDPVIGFTTSGEPFPLRNDLVPSRPVLVLVPIETDFSNPLNLDYFVNEDDAGGAAIGEYRIRSTPIQSSLDFWSEVTPRFQDCTYETCTGGGGGGTSPSSGLYLTQDVIDDVHEPWNRGEPEIEILTFYQPPLSNEGTQIRCSAEGGGDEFFAQNDVAFSGEVHIATHEQLAATEGGRGLMFIMYEDDDTTCEIKDDSGYINNLVDIAEGVESGRDGLSDDPFEAIVQIVETLMQIVPAVASILNTNDDFIGEIVGGACNGQPFEIRAGNDVDGCATVQALYYGS